MTDLPRSGDPCVAVVPAPLYTVLVNWNGWEDTIACVRSLRAAEHGDLIVVACDNASTDGSADRLTEWADATLCRAPPQTARLPVDRARHITEWVAPDRAGFRFVLIENDDNLGFAGGNNVGIALALADPACRHVFLLNNDTEIAPDALTALTTKAEADRSLAVIGATLVFHEQPDRVQGLGAAYDRKRARARTLFAGGALAALPHVDAIEREIEYVIGAAMFIRADVLRRTGGLSEAYFLYYEELDFAQRLLPGERQGWAPGAVIRHKVGGSIGTGRVRARPSNISLYYDHRSKIRFYRAHCRSMTPFLAAALAKTMLAYLRRGDVVAVRVILCAIRDYARQPKDYRADLSRFAKPK
ncbi:glycosyltransferase family 2 protein [Sphingomonas faeni]|uniref:glycosyltransferase family 2 protein n=1 Tax=Sphingomonas faeni TaxID=185950 RepID=UPI00335A146E